MKKKAGNSKSRNLCKIRIAKVTQNGRLIVNVDRLYRYLENKNKADAA